MGGGGRIDVGGGGIYLASGEAFARLHTFMIMIMAASSYGCIVGMRTLAGYFGLSLSMRVPLKV